MHRLLILIVMTLCFVFGLMAPAFANDYCPPVWVQDNQWCSCVVWNYGTGSDGNVTIFLDTPDGGGTCGPLSIAAGGRITCEEQVTSGVGYCTCKVTGEGTYSRTSLVVNDTDYTAHVSVACR